MNDEDCSTDEEEMHVNNIDKKRKYNQQTKCKSLLKSKPKTKICSNQENKDKVTNLLSAIMGIL